MGKVIAVAAQKGGVEKTSSCRNLATELVNKGFKVSMKTNLKQQLYIPQGLKTRVEIFDGFKKEELFKIIIVVLVAGGVDALLFLLFRNVVTGVVFMLIAIAGSVMMLTKDKDNISMVDQVGFMIRFSKSQKVYKYKYLEE